MLEANILQLRRYAPETQLTLISADPVASANFYQVPTVPCLGFGIRAKNHPEHLATILEAAQNRLVGPLDHSQPFHLTIEALYRADALLISGGGNINSTWPEHVYERMALIKVAQLFQKQIIITGQTIGPTLKDQERSLLEAVLPHVSILGVRERPSAQLAPQLGVPLEKISFQLDDAFYLSPKPIEEPLAFDINQPFIALTISPYVNPETDSHSLDLLAAQLQTVDQLTNVPLVFIPHISQSRYSHLTDALIGDYLKSKLDTLIVLPVYTAREVVWLTNKAALIISARYHPLVFGIAAQIPCLGLYVDEYTKTKLTGALAHAGLAEWAMPIEAAVHGLLPDAVQELWSRRDEINQHLMSCQPYWQHLYTAHWSKLLDAFDLPNSDSVSLVPPPSAPERLLPEGNWLRMAHILDAAKQDWDSQFNRLKTSFRQVEEYALILDQERIGYKAHIAELLQFQQDMASRHAFLGGLAKIKASILQNLDRLLPSRHED